jgi:hypothetical protein
MEGGMNLLMGIHVAAGIVALCAGTLAVAGRKGGALHARAGTWFFGSMLALGVTASILEPMKDPPESGLGGVFVCYFVLTSWVAARRRDGVTGRFEIIAGLVALLGGSLSIWGALNGATTPVGVGPVFAVGGLWLFAGLLDFHAVLRRKLSSAQRIARHLWRMCFAFFIATGSFFLGQQDVLPEMAQGSPILLLLAFAPFLVMAFWLVSVRLPRVGKRIRKMARPLVDPAGV